MAPFRRPLDREHVRSPYTRGPGSVPASPAPSQMRPPKTPGSIFSKVKQMFSPTTWIREQDAPSTANANSSGEFNDSDVSLQSVQSDTSRIVTNPINEFQRMRHQSSIQQLRAKEYTRAGSESPNVKLAKFFSSKGSEPLSEVELAGVRALLAETASASASPKTPRTPSVEPNEDDSEENISHNSMVLKPETSVVSPALTTTPSFKATYNASVVADPDVSISSNATPKRRVFDYSGFPSPYRTSRLKRSTLALRSEFNKPDEKEKSADKKAEPQPEKKLSNTASALLSFIQNGEEASTEKTKNDNEEEEDKREIDFSNPYARPKKSSRPSVSKKPSPLEQLEKTFQSQSPAQPEKVSLPIVDKYKPARSSSLRESVTLEDDADKEDKDSEMDVDDKKQEQEVEMPKFGFENSSGFGSKAPKTTTAPTQTFSFNSAKTEDKSAEKKDQEVAKPAFSFDAPSTTTTAPETGKPAFSFGSTSNNTTSTPPSFSFGTAPAKEESNTSLTIKPAQEVQLANGNSTNAPTSHPAAFSQFTFPGAEDLGLTMKDVDESKLVVYRNLFTF
ncbi:CYFA0S05e04830g1_1 [Cyberlindnera fabianii]|uniref:CYFA0S05e04830g1_1 n=1 Tax=Cyberlindnera fabianii TaxID=36022 RepID=A0A061ATA5_CYBFA|nr:CYFA0S05e04830g1_1 [Cyberlindnera fabianii]